MTVLLHAELDSRRRTTLLALPDGDRLVLDAGRRRRQFEISPIIDLLFRLLLRGRALLGSVVALALLLLQRRILLSLIEHLRVVQVHRVHAVRRLGHASLAGLIWERHLSERWMTVEVAQVLDLVNRSDVLIELHVYNF